MKRSIILFVLLSFLLCACSSHNDKPKSPVNFYYLNQTITYNSQTGIIAPQIREGAGYENDILSLMNVYIKGPDSQLFISPFPDRLEILDISQAEGVAYLTVSDQICMLTGHDLTLACVCLSRTVMDLTNMNAVQIAVPDRLIDGKTSLMIRAEDIVYMDEAAYGLSEAD